MGTIQRYVGTKSRCWTCNREELDDINEALRDGVGVSGIIKYLVDVKGYDPQEDYEGRIRGHFRRGHHTAKGLA